MKAANSTLSMIQGRTRCTGRNEGLKETPLKRRRQGREEAEEEKKYHQQHASSKRCKNLGPIASRTRSCARCGDGDGAAHDLVEHGPPEWARLEDVERCKVALDQRLQGPGGKESM